jgi:hypothetical protein
MPLPLTIAELKAIAERDAAYFSSPEWAAEKARLAKEPPVPDHLKLHFKPTRT